MNLTSSTMQNAAGAFRRVPLRRDQERRDDGDFERAMDMEPLALDGEATPAPSAMQERG